MQSQRGFTLTELMVVVAIIAVLAGLMVGMSPRPYNANAQVIADQMTSTLIYTRTRAVSTRKVHRVEIYETASGEQVVEVSAAATTGMAVPATPPTDYWQTVEVKRIPSSAIIQAVEAGVAVMATGATPAANIDLPLYFKPDGSATGSTMYITDRAAAPRFSRVLVYPATGSSYAREGW